MIVESPRFRLVVAAVLLAATLVFVVVALSQLFLGVATDPRDTLGSRAAGFGFTDLAHQTLFGVIPLALPLAAVLLCDHPAVRLTAAVEYGVLIVAGAAIAGLAFLFRLDVAEEQLNAAGTVFMTKRSAVESLATDATTLVLAGVGLIFSVRAWRRVRPAVS